MISWSGTFGLLLIFLRVQPRLTLNTFPINAVGSRNINFVEDCIQGDMASEPLGTTVFDNVPSIHLIFLILISMFVFRGMVVIVILAFVYILITRSVL